MTLKISQKQQKSYRIHFSVSQFAMLGFLFTMSLIFSFYLGLVTGKSIRPAESIASAKNPKPQQSASLSAEQLSFFQSIEGGDKTEKKSTFSTKQLEKLRNTTKRIAQKQERARKEKAQRTAQQSPPKAKPAKRPSAPPQAPAESVAQTQPPLVSARTTGTYTLQVFTSGNKKTAETWVKRLKENGYLEAYLHPHKNAANQTLYRVRIARTSKASAEALANKLKELDYIDHVQITRL